MGSASCIFRENRNRNGWRNRHGRGSQGFNPGTNQGYNGGSNNHGYNGGSNNQDTMEDPTTKDTMEDLTIMDTMEDLTIMDLVVVGLTVVAEFQVHIYFLVLDNLKENLTK